MPRTLDEVLIGYVTRLQSDCLYLDFYDIDYTTYNKPTSWETEITSKYKNSPIKEVTFSLVEGQDRSAWTDDFIPAAQFTGNVNYRDGSTSTTTITVEFSYILNHWKINLTKWLEL